MQDVREYRYEAKDSTNTKSTRTTAKMIHELRTTNTVSCEVVGKVDGGRGGEAVEEEEEEAL